MLRASSTSELSTLIPVRQHCVPLLRTPRSWPPPLCGQLLLTLGSSPLFWEVSLSAQVWVALLQASWRLLQVHITLSSPPDWEQLGKGAVWLVPSLNLAQAYRSSSSYSTITSFSRLPHTSRLAPSGGASLHHLHVRRG